MIKEFISANREKIAEDRKTYDVLPTTKVERHTKEMRAKMVKVREEAGGDWDLTKVKEISGPTDEAKAQEIIDLHSRLCAAQEVLTYRASIQAQLDDEIDAAAQKGPLLSLHPANALVEPEGVFTSLTKHYEDAGGYKPGEPGFYNQIQDKDLILETEDVQAVLFKQSPGWTPRDPRSGHLQYQPLPRMSVLDNIRIKTLEMNDASYIYMEETAPTSPADMGLAEGAAASEFTFQVNQKSVPIVKRGGVLPVTEEVLDQRDSVKEYLDFRLPELLREDVTKQFVAGNGTAPNMEGVATRTGVQAVEVDAEMTKAIDQMIYAVLRPEEVAERPSTHAFVHPTLIRHIYMTKDSDKNYIMGHPSQAMPAAILGVPLLNNKLGFSYALDGLVGLVGDFVMGACLVVRNQIMVETGMIGDQFKEWKKTLRVGTRSAAVTFRPASFAKVEVASTGTLAG